jgi:probable F420-dependent oxidoreductase
MPKPFRFGVQLHSLDAAHWIDEARRIESLGYSSVFWPDHFGTQWDPTTAIAAVAAVTTRLRVGTLVYDVDYRHPVVLAKAAATQQLLSGGRQEFGLGAGWMEEDYQQAGIAYDRPGVRIERLEEALEIIRSMWTQERTSFAGKHYHIDNISQAAEPAAAGPPKILIGGGGPRVLGIAGRHADIVGINPMIPEGRVNASVTRDMALERVLEKVRWVRDAAAEAGRPEDAIEFNSLIFAVGITDDPAGIRGGLAKNTGMSVEDVEHCPLFLTGSVDEICDRLETRREQTGISYIVIQAHSTELVEEFGEKIVARLNGH